MDNDDFMIPNDGSLLQEDIKLTREQQQEQAEVFRELPIIAKTIRNMKKQVRFYESIHAIPDSLTPEEHMHAVWGNKIGVEVLTNEIATLEQLVREHTDE